MEKENQSENEFKRNLFESFKKQGVTDMMKSQMRSKLLTLVHKGQIETKIPDSKNNLEHKIVVSMIMDFMKRNEMQYSLSVFAPECGFGSKVLGKDELEDIMKTKKSKDARSFIETVVANMRTGESMRGNVKTCETQTDEGVSSLSIDQKLRRLDSDFADKIEAERIMPFKTLEERFLRYKKECDARMQEEIRSEVNRVRESEIAKIRLEESQKYRNKLAEYRNEMERMHSDKIKELKIREREMLDRVRNESQQLEGASFEHRQKIISDLEMLRMRENDMKKTVDMEQIVINGEKSRMNEKERELDKLIRDSEYRAEEGERRQAEEIAQFKNEVERKYERDQRDVQKKKLELEHEMARFQLDKQNYIHLETEKGAIEKDLLEVKEELRDVRRDRDQIQRDYLHYQEDLRQLTEQQKRDRNIIEAREHENKMMKTEQTTLSTMNEELKGLLGTTKNDHCEIIKNLRLQLDETRVLIETISLQKTKDVRKLVTQHEEEINREREDRELEMNRMQNDLQIMNKKIQQEEHLNKELAVLNHRLKENKEDIRVTNELTQYQSRVAKDMRQHAQSSSPQRPYTQAIKQEKYEPLFMTSFVTGELLERRKAWALLSKEDNEVQMNIQALKRTQPEAHGVTSTYNDERLYTKSFQYQANLEKEYKKTRESISENMFARESSQQQIKPKKKKKPIKEDKIEATPQFGFSGITPVSEKPQKKPTILNKGPFAKRTTTQLTDDKSDEDNYFGKQPVEEIQQKSSHDLYNKSIVTGSEIIDDYQDGFEEEEGSDPF